MSMLLHSMQSYIAGSKAWTTANMLKLIDKTDLMLVTSKRTKCPHDQPTSLTIGKANFLANIV